MAGKKKHRLDKKYKKQIKTERKTGIGSGSLSLSSMLPRSFLSTIKEMLPGEYEAFLSAMEAPRHQGLRVNPLKISPEEFEKRTSFHLRKIPWIRGGFYYDPFDNPAGSADYAAGLYYLQEPSAMTPASRLPVRPGDRVLDLCAAPGGKATALGAALGGKGLLVANDINRARARALLHNIELFGIGNAVVCARPPYKLAQEFPEYFDCIMVDAPCSGEGMFRKNPAVIEAWIEKGPDYFSRIQKEITVQAADMIRPGGLMLYSTCTFSPLENEAVISNLLEARPEMEVVPMEDYEGFSPGLLSFRNENYHETMILCRRIWPHRMEGEGHFMALLRKKSPLTEGKDPVPGKNNPPAGDVGQTRSRISEGGGRIWSRIPGADPDQVRSMEEFFSCVRMDVDPARLEVRGDKICYLPAEAPGLSGPDCLRRGLYLGQLKKKRFEPAQSLALALNKDQYKHVIDFSREAPDLVRYLKGESLPVAGNSDAGRDGGWHLVRTEGYPLGFGKISHGILKNKYPAGWRWNG